MKRGFTLVELLAVIVIIGIVSLIAVPAAVNYIEESRQKLYVVQVQNIELASKKWATSNMEQLDREYLNTTFISVEMLKDLSFLAKDELKNPTNSEIMKGCIAVSYDAVSKTYTYKYDDENIDCKTNDAKGYYYIKNSDGVWEKDLTNKRESIFSYLIGENNENIVVTGSGLYDMEDRYVFRGNVTNNYVKLDGTYFRILSLDKTTKTMKLIAVTNSGSAVWGTSSGNNSFNTSTLYTETLNKSLYPTITNQNVKWNIGRIENISELNINTVKAYESKTKIVSELGLISMSEYMEASANIDCSNGVLSSCALDNYLDIEDSWTTSTTDSSAVYIDKDKGISYETDLVSSHHNIYRTMNIMPMEKSGEGTYSNPFVISIKES